MLFLDFSLQFINGLVRTSVKFIAKAVDELRSVLNINQKQF